MWEIWVLWVLRVLAGKVCHLEAEGLREWRWRGAGLDLVNRQSNGKGLWLIQP